MIQINKEIYAYNIILLVDAMATPRTKQLTQRKIWIHNLRIVRCTYSSFVIPISITELIKLFIIFVVGEKLRIKVIENVVNCNQIRA